MSLRYTTISLYLSVALVALSALVPSLIFPARVRCRLLPVGGLLVGLFVALQSWIWVYGAWGLQQWHAARLQSLAQYLFRDFSDTEHLVRLDKTPDYAREQLDRLVTMGYLRLPQTVSAGSFSQFSVSQEVVAPADGNLVRIFSIDEPGGTGWRIDGFTDIRPYTRRAPDAILFTVGEEDERVIVGFAEPIPSPDCHFIRYDFEFSALRLLRREEKNHWSGCCRSHRR